jgi:hypothetical protein
MYWYFLDVFRNIDIGYSTGDPEFNTFAATYLGIAITWAVLIH